MERRVAAAVVFVLCLGVGPLDARAPRGPAPGWDLFAADALLEALAGAFPAPAPGGAPLPSRRPLHATPEPGTGLLGALGLGALAARRRRAGASR